MHLRVFGYIKMPNNKKQKNVEEFWEKNNPCEKPSWHCWRYVLALIVQFYYENNFSYLESFSVLYAEEELKKFDNEMHFQIIDALQAHEWDKDRQRRGYTHFFKT